ncbi:putative RNA-directed DNA polymerase from transposon X-element [Trichonephila clavipes]|nr:putative RNA-directed DNA polymerase from transposon X-element [Trichonephila clavipes]
MQPPPPPKPFEIPLELTEPELPLTNIPGVPLRINIMRFSAVRFGNAISSFKQSETGLPQGAVISPILFNIFINDLPDLLASDGLTNTALFADDLAIWCSTPKRDQSKLNTILNLTLERLHL